MSSSVCNALCSAFHNLASKIPIDWETDSTANVVGNPCRSQRMYEQAYIQNVYNQRINKKMLEKYNSSFDTFRVLPNDLALSRGRDTLSKQLEAFNAGKLASTPNPHPPLS